VDSAGEEHRSVPVEFPVVGLVLDRRTGAVLRRDDSLALLVGSVLQVGRDPRVCHLALPRDNEVSQVAVAIKYDIVDPGGGRPVRPNVRLWCRQGGAGTVTVEGAGEAFTLRGWGPPVTLRPDTRYEVSVFTPAPVLRLEFHTPALGTPPVEKPDSGTVTWTMSGPTAPSNPEWTRVVALAVLIEKFPDVIPYRDGKRVSSMRALTMLGESFCQRSRPAWYSAQLDAALRSQDIVVEKNEDRIGRVAAYFGQRADLKQLARLRDRILEYGTLDDE